MNALQRFCREGVAWKHLRHPNILPLLGVTISGTRFAMVSKWMENGNINEFVEKNRHANRIELVRRPSIPTPTSPQLMWCSVGRRCERFGVHAWSPHGPRRSERGMCFSQTKYLHIWHSSTKANILINKHQRACIADFGLSTITGVTTHPAPGASRASLISNDSLMSFTTGGTRRWMSPELLDPEMFGISQYEGDRPTRQSDCYALGMVIYEVRVCVNRSVVEAN
jgi:serine/threonine protein kinase